MPVGALIPLFGTDVLISVNLDGDSTLASTLDVTQYLSVVLSGDSTLSSSFTIQVVVNTNSAAQEVIGGWLSPHEAPPLKVNFIYFESTLHGDSELESSIESFAQFVATLTGDSRVKSRMKITTRDQREMAIILAAIKLLEESS